jgi:PAS domain S-box-containing protein
MVEVPDRLRSSSRDVVPPNLDEHFRLLFAEAGEAVLVLDADWRIVSANHAAELMLGHEPAELTGRLLLDLVAPEWRSLGARRLEAVAEPAPFECALVDCHGFRIPVEIVAAAAGESALAIVRDLLSRARAEVELRESEERFRIAFDAAPIGMALVAVPAGRFLRVNRALCELTGYAEGELLERTFQDITHPDDLDADLALMHRLLAGELGSYSLEKRYLRRDGTEARVQLSGTLVRGPGGEPIYAIGHVEDLASRRDLPPSWAGPALSAREREVLGALAAGATSAEIAAALAIGVETVHTHARRATAKLGARTRTEAVALALRRGLLDEPPRARAAA